MRSALIATMVCSLTAHARPIQVPTYRELQDRADLVLLLKVQDITETNAKTEEYGDPDFYQGYKARCQVLSVFKGKPEQAVVSIPFFQHPAAMPGFDGAIPAPFSLDNSLVFLAYLKRSPKGELTPVTGEYDAGLSIKMMFDHGADPRHVKLPPHQSKVETNAETIIETHNQEVSAAMRSFAAARGQSWMTNYYGKTLSSLGEIDNIRILDHTTQTTPNWTHRDLWQIVEHSKVQDYPKGAVSFWVPPVFAIEYSGGLRVQADRCNVMIFLPDGRKGSAFLATGPQRP